MPLMTASERSLATAISTLVYANPFLAERIEAERQALGEAFVEADPVWAARPAGEDDSPNLPALDARARALADSLRERASAGTPPRPDEIALYEDVVLYVLYNRYFPKLDALIGTPAKSTERQPAFVHFARDLEHYLGAPAVASPAREDPAHLFALFFQIRRAFHFTFNQILGGSRATAGLRATVWESIFTQNLRLYRETLWNRMHDFTTLIVGPSGTGKELVAQAIGFSRYVPFEAGKHAFVEDFARGFLSINVSALAPTLIESELFGHRRGAFTGAVEDHAGYLESCPPCGSVFLDEIGELAPWAQVKLLRVLETREFQRIGDIRTRRFRGKFIAATNRDLAAEIKAGRFRQDLYYRLCADVVKTPSLDEQLRDARADMIRLLRFLAARMVGDGEANALAERTLDWINAQITSGYRWPGNVRELEQCMRNVLIRGEYRPAEALLRSDDALAATLDAGSFTVADLTRIYCTRVYASTGSYIETARRLGLDRRTIKDHIDPELLARLRGQQEGQEDR